MAFDYDKIIQDLRAAGNEADAQAVEELLGQLYEAEEALEQFRYDPEDRSTPEAKRKYRIAIQTYYDRRLLKTY
jgi:hypothetical protein